MDTLDTMDTFVEQIVAKKKGGREYGIIALVVLGALILTAALFLLVLVASGRKGEEIIHA